jgi:hypothetical protein
MKARDGDPGGHPVTVLLVSALALAWLAVSVVFLATCFLAGRTDRLAARSAATLPHDLRLVQRELVGHR